MCLYCETQQILRGKIDHYWKKKRKILLQELAQKLYTKSTGRGATKLENQQKEVHENVINAIEVTERKTIK